jgi:hypothetical protein
MAPLRRRLYVAVGFGEPAMKRVVLQCNSQWLTVDDQGYVMQFTRLIASKAMTDSVATASLKMLHRETQVAGSPTRVHRLNAHASMTIKIWTAAWL